MINWFIEFKSVEPITHLNLDLSNQAVLRVLTEMVSEHFVESKISFFLKSLRWIDFAEYLDLEGSLKLG